jgi:hypothetical protein
MFNKVLLAGLTNSGKTHGALSIKDLPNVNKIIYINTDMPSNFQPVFNRLTVENRSKFEIIDLFGKSYDDIVSIMKSIVDKAIEPKNGINALVIDKLENIVEAYEESYFKKIGKEPDPLKYGIAREEMYQQVISPLIIAPLHFIALLTLDVKFELKKSLYVETDPKYQMLLDSSISLSRWKYNFNIIAFREPDTQSSMGGFNTILIKSKISMKHIKIVNVNSNLVSYIIDYVNLEISKVSGKI